MNPHLPAICIYTLILLLMPGSCNGQTLRTLQGEVREQPSLAVVPENDSSSGNTAPQLRGDIPLRYSTDDDDP
ncbi:MAG: hypothetical protein KDA85_02905, partial [Planctomycetaceae bacterium]|nr:hypothetical protein [Planctomycetaceae bacterium]